MLDKNTDSCVITAPKADDNSLFFMLSQELLCIAGFDGYFKKLNNAWEKTLGYSQDELLAKPFIEFVHIDDQENSQNLVTKLVNGHNTSAFENRLLCKDGSVRWILWSTVSVVEDQLLYASGRDITDRKKIEQDLQIRNDQIEKLINVAPFGIYMVDDNLIIRHINPYAIPSFGNISNLINQDFSEVMHILWAEPKADDIIKLFKHTLETGISCVVPEMIEKRADRDVTEYYSWEIHRIPMPSGKLGVACYFQDISHRVLAQQTIIESEKRYHTLFNCMDEGYCVIEMLFDAQHKPFNYRFLEVNPPFELQSGLVNATGKTILELIPDFNSELIATYGQVALTGEPIRFEHEVLELNRWFDVYAFRIKTPENNKIAILFSNITERKSAELALKENQERLKAFVMSSSDAIYSMSPNWEMMNQVEGRNFVKEGRKSNSNWLQDNIYPDDHALILNNVKQAIQTKSVFELEHRVIRTDNSTGWTYSRAVPLFNKQGDITEWFGTASDVTNRKMAQDALRITEKRYHTLFNSIDEGFFVVEKIETKVGVPSDYVFIEANPAFEKLTGVNDVVGKTIRQLFSGIADDFYRTYDTVISTGESIRFVAEVFNKRVHELFVFRIQDQVHCSLAILFQDVTERIRTQEDLRESQRFLRSSLDALSGHIAVLDESGKILAVNEAWRHYASENHLIMPDYGIGTSYIQACAQTIANESDTNAYASGISDVITGRKTHFELEYACHSPTEQRWFIMRVTRFQSPGPVRIVIVHDNCTERKLAERASRESDERFRVLFELGPVAMYTVDGIGTIQEFNRNAVTMWGREPTRGDPGERYCCAYKIYSPDGADILHAENSVAAVLKGLVPFVQDVEAILERLDGSKINVIANVVPLKNSNNEITGAMSCLVDITDRKRIENTLFANNIELQDAKLAAEKANLAKSEFLSSMSHELRTPLNAILGFAQLLSGSQPALSNPQQSNIAQILHGGWYLLELINEILDLAQIESGQQTLLLESVVVEQVMQECQELMQQQADQYSIEMHLTVTENLHHVLVDKTRLKQIFINLLSNAIKYNKKNGAVTMHCKQTNNVIRISVIDTGSGLSSDELGQLFQPFNRLHKKFSAIEGTGIGLVVSKRLVELMQGNIGVQSTVGVGSEFWVEFELLTA